MKKHWMLLAALFMLSCSDDNDPIKEEPGTDEPGIEVVEPEPYRANRMLIKHGLPIIMNWVERPGNLPITCRFRIGS